MKTNDMADYKDNLEARIVVSNWMSTHYTVDFLAVWEQVNNPNFNRMGFHTVRNSEGRNLIPKEITKQQASFVYANEADLLNVALFGITAKEWRDSNPDKNSILNETTAE